MTSVILQSLRRRFVELLCALLLIGVGAAPRPAMAQTGCASAASCTIDVSMTVSQGLSRLSVTSALTVPLGTPTEADFVQTFKDAANPSTVTVRSNQTFSLTVKGHASTFSYTGSLTNPNKPASDLLWATTSAGLLAPNNMGAPALLFPTTPGLVSASIFYRTKWKFSSDLPGTYALLVDLTLSAP
jgi:hypothetical protein